VDPLCRGPDWKPITPKRGSFLHADSHTYLSIIAALLFVILLWPPPANAEEQARGMGSYLLGPGMPIIFTFDRHSMSCAVSWGTLGAPGPGPYSAPPDMNKVNFGMVVFSLEISSFEVTNNRVTMTGLARSITTMNQWIIENAIYDFKVEAVDGGPPAQDSFSMTARGMGSYLLGPGMPTIFTFDPAGLVSGDIVIRPGYFCSTAVVSFMKFSLGNG
jgi:hypothetical protein